MALDVEVCMIEYMHAKVVSITFHYRKFNIRPFTVQII